MRVAEREGKVLIASLSICDRNAKMRQTNEKEGGEPGNLTKGTFSIHLGTANGSRQQSVLWRGRVSLWCARRVG